MAVPTSGLTSSTPGPEIVPLKRPVTIRTLRKMVASGEAFACLVQAIFEVLPASNPAAASSRLSQSDIARVLDRARDVRKQNSAFLFW